MVESLDKAIATGTLLAVFDVCTVGVPNEEWGEKTIRAAYWD